MKAFQTATRLLKSKTQQIQRTFQTANQKQVEAAAAATATAVSDVDAKREWDLAKPFSAIPGPKPLPIPYVGNLWRIFFSDWGKDMAVMHRDLYEEYGPIVKLTGMGKTDLVFLFDPVDVEKMFRNESIWPERLSLSSLKYYRTVVRKDFYEGCKGLVGSEGEDWQKFRSATNQTMMRPANVIMYLDSVAAVVDEFIERVRLIRNSKEEMPEDFIKELNRLALESFGVVTLDIRLGCLANDLSPDSEAMKLIENVRDALSMMYALDFKASFWKFFSTPTWRRYVKKMDEILEIACKHTFAKWESLKKQGKSEMKTNRSILEMLLLNTNDPKIPIVMATDTLLAGIDTTSTTTATALYHLAINPDKQEKLFQEIKQLLPTKNTKITKQIFNESKYVKAVIKESLRMKPTVSSNQRMTKSDIVCSGYQIPNGTYLIAVHQIMCLMETHFKDPLKFIPERWLRQEKSECEYSNKNRHPFVFLPFGFGQRSCIGRRIAELEIELLLTKLIRNFQISYHYEPMTWHSLLFTYPSKPLKFKMTDRPE